MSEATFKVRGSDARVPASKLSQEALDWYCDECRNEELQAAARAERARRGGGGGNQQGRRQPPPDRTAIVKQATALQGARDTAAAATDALTKVQEIGHLVSPAPACATLPEGTSIVLSAIMVDADTETYPVQGGRGLSKVALNKLARASGISWDPQLSRRLDDGRDPHYVHFRAVGYLRDFDGTVQTISGEKVLDLREGSPQLAAIRDRCERKAERARNQGNNEEGDPELQIRDLRLFILEHAETKAKNRAIRSCGIRTSYKRSELEKPFFAAKVQFTGRSDDPEIRKMFAARIADSFTGASGALYSAQSQQAALPSGYTPPPAGTGHDDDDPAPIDTNGSEVEHDGDGVAAAADGYYDDDGGEDEGY